MAMRRNAFVSALAVALSTASAWSARAADTAVDLELVLAVDISRSMDFDEQQLQRDGYIAAITHPDVVSAIEHGAHGKIALTYLEWAGPAVQATVVDWRVIDGAASAEAFAAALAAVPIRSFRGTAISDGLTFAKARFDGNGYDGPRRVIDVSGDGPNNMGTPIELARDAVVQAGITINGLPIMIKQPGGFAAIADLDVYYQDCVIGGGGAFVVVVHSADQFAEAIRRKLVLEIADRMPASPIEAATATKVASRIDCFIGEKLRRQWMQE
jgi:hypothetical protein